MNTQPKYSPESYGSFLLPQNDGSSTSAVLFAEARGNHSVMVEDYPSVGNAVEMPVHFLAFHREVNLIELSHHEHLESLRLIGKNDRVHPDASVAYILMDIHGEEVVIGVPGRPDFQFGLVDRSHEDQLTMAAVLIVRHKGYTAAVNISGTLNMKNGHVALSQVTFKEGFRAKGYVLRAFRDVGPVTSHVALPQA